MINGVLHPSQLSPSVFTQSRARPPAASSASVADKPQAAAMAPAEPERQAMYRDYQVLGLASRQFAEILPQIESLDVPIE